MDRAWRCLPRGVRGLCACLLVRRRCVSYDAARKTRVTTGRQTPAPKGPTGRAEDGVRRANPFQRPHPQPHRRPIASIRANYSEHGRLLYCLQCCRDEGRGTRGKGRGARRRGGSTVPRHRKRQHGRLGASVPPACGNALSSAFTWSDQEETAGALGPLSDQHPGVRRAGTKRAMHAVADGCNM